MASEPASSSTTQIGDGGGGGGVGVLFVATNGILHIFPPLESMTESGEHCVSPRVTPRGDNVAGDGLTGRGCSVCLCVCGTGSRQNTNQF